MIPCPFCQARYLDNGLFCPKCGMYLPDDDKQSTHPLQLDDLGLDIQEISQMREPAGIRWFPSTFRSAADKPVAIHLNLKERHQSIEINLGQSNILIGRKDPHLNSRPDVDLTHIGSLATSISRRHAQLSRAGNLILVEDLASVNGTYLNSQRLDPYLPEPLNHGYRLGMEQKKDIDIRLYRA